MTAKRLKNLLSVSFLTISVLISHLSVAQVGTAKFRQRINQDLPTNNSKAITAAKLRSVFSASADAIDSIYTTLSLAENIGEYDASTGVAKVTATGSESTPGTTPAFADGSHFDVVKAGAQSITGTAIDMVVGSKIIVRGTKWAYIPPSDMALQKAIQAQTDTRLVEKLNISSGGEAAAGATIDLTASSISVPNGSSGFGTYIQKPIPISSRPLWKVGSTIHFSSVVTENTAGISTSLKPRFSLNVTRNGSIVQTGLIGSMSRISSTQIQLDLDYTIQSGDEILRPLMQMATSATNSSGSTQTWTWSSIVANVKATGNELTPISEKLIAVEGAIQTNATSITATNQLISATDGKIAAVENQLAISDLIAEPLETLAQNGGVVDGSAGTITIPIGQTGFASNLRKSMLFSNHPAMVIGARIRFFVVVKESVAGLTNTKAGCFLSVRRSGSFVTNVGVNASSTYVIDATTRRYQFEYTIQSGDDLLQPYLQILGMSVSNSSGSPWVVSVQSMYWQVVNPATETNVITDRLKSINTSIVTANTTIATKSVNLTAIPTSYSGEALNGATGANTKRITIPSGSSGHTSYIRAQIPISEFSNWNDIVGVPVSFAFKVATSADFYPTKNFTVSMAAFRSGAWNFTASITGTSITKLSPTVLQIRFTYTPDANDAILAPSLQISLSSISLVASTSFFEIQDVTYSHASPLGFPTENTYPIAKDRSWLNGKVSTLAGRVGALENSSTAITVVTKTVKPDGTGDYLSPKLANDAITDSSPIKQYDVTIYPGIYTEVEWRSKPFVTWRGTDKNACWLKGELPDSTGDGHRETSTLWLVKTASLVNLKITAKNMRYAVHSEESGANPDAVHNVVNCHLEHYGNQGMIDWRTANSGSGLLVSNVWASARPWGYGAASGLIENYDNTSFYSQGVEAYYVHSNLNFNKPNVNTLRNSAMARKNFNAVIVVQSLGSGQNDLVNLYGCSITPGFIRQDDTPWISQIPQNQYANHADYKIFASGSSMVGYRDATRGRALRIRSNSVSAGSKVRVSGTAVPAIFGRVHEIDGGVGLQGYSYGHWDISGILVGLAQNVTVNNTLGRRLGDCSTVSKTLTITIDNGAPINVVFNTNLSSETNANILATINAALGSSATASEYNSAQGEYYPEFQDRILILTNTGTTGIPRWNAVGYNTDRTNMRLITTADPASKFIGVALEPIPVGKMGRILVSGILDKAAQIPGVTGSISLDTDISISSTVNGQFEISSSKPVMRGVATDWVQFGK